MNLSPKPLINTRVVFGVTGGIAAYKAVEVCRRLVDAGAYVSPILTDAAVKMVGPTTFSALASERARTSLWEDPDVIPHTTLGQNADVVVVCPATARILSDLRTGRSADLLSATLLATEAPVVVCPAMHTEMWNHPAVQDNISTLQARGVVIVGPEPGRLAGGDTGFGRLAEPETVVDAVVVAAAGSQSPPTGGDLEGLSVVVTAGGTQEAIDPVRYLSNKSSGRQGHALAECAAARGASVTLITASRLPLSNQLTKSKNEDVRFAGGTSARITRVDVESAAEMASAVKKQGSADVVIMAAAVADFRPEQISNHKIKKADGLPEIRMVPTEDILASLGETRKPHQVIVGFAAETDNLIENAQKKLRSKKVDVIVANDVSSADAGFDVATNAVVIMQSDGTRHNVGLTSKYNVAEAVLDAVHALIQTRKGN